jgi:hypothetical protein
LPNRERFFPSVKFAFTGHKITVHASQKSFSYLLSVDFDPVTCASFLSDEAHHEQEDIHD